MSSLFDLSGKVAVITGASKGIGRAIAERMAEHGAKVVVSSRKQDACDVVTNGIIARGGPNERSPSGGYLAAAANWRASAALLIIGAMIASAPKSSARLTSAKSFSGTRTIAAAPA